MGKFGDWLSATFTVPPSPSTALSPQFEVDAESIPAQIFGLESYSSHIAPVARVSRREAIQCAAVKRARDLITTLGTLPLVLRDSENIEHVNDLLVQPERHCPRTKTMVDTVDDLLMEGIAYWRVIERAYDGYPRFIKRIHPSKVSVDEDTGTVRINGRQVPAQDVIQFHSPNDALLVAGARAIRHCLHLEHTIANYAEGTPPIDYFTPAEGADPADDDEIVALLNAWKDARMKRSTAYIPASLNYHINGWNPEQLQLADARQQSVLDIARCAGVDPEELGVSTTSRTYANQQDRRRVFLDFTLGAYMHVIEDRLSMGDVTKRGYHVRFDLTEFLRSDDKTRMETYQIGLEVGAITRDEVREAENRPALAPRPEPQTVAGELA